MAPQPGDRAHGAIGGRTGIRHRRAEAGDGEHPTSGSDEPAALVLGHAGAEDVYAWHRGRLLHAVDDVAVARRQGIALARTHHGYRGGVRRKRALLSREQQAGEFKLR